MHFGGGVLFLLCGWVVLLYKLITRKAMAAEREAAGQASGPATPPPAELPPQEAPGHEPGRRSPRRSSSSSSSMRTRPPGVSPPTCPSPPSSRYVSPLESEPREEERPTAEVAAAAPPAATAARPAAASPRVEESCSSSPSAEETPVSKREALQAILMQVYLRTGDSANLLDVETEARLLTGEVFSDERILTKQEASRAIHQVTSSSRLARKTDSETALMLLEECLAALGFFPRPSILAGI